MNTTGDLGVDVKNFVLLLSDALKSPAAPGWAVIFLSTLLLLLTVWMWVSTARFRRAVKAARAIVVGEGGEDISGEEVTALSTDFVGWRNEKTGTRRALGIAWKEFEETLVRSPAINGVTPIGNTVRPSNFFNLADMGVSTSFWRAWPGVFVTLGLFLTFLGLIAALNTIGGDLSEEALSELLTVASAKFIMSLTGLFCSIVFGFFLRWRLGRMDDALHRLCDAIERRLQFVSLEELAVRQLVAIEKQSDETRKVLYDMIARIDEPLNTGLPNAIRAGIAEAMMPVVEKIGTAGSDGVGAMVEGLSEKIAGDVGGALTQASDRLAEAGASLESLAGRMDASSSRMGGEMEGAISRLAASVEEMRESAGAAAQQTSASLTESAETLFAGMRDALDGIQRNTAENGAALEKAAAAMTEAAGTFKAEIGAAAQESREAARIAMDGAGRDAAAQVDAAGLAVTDSLGTTLTAVMERAEAMGGKVSDDLLAPFDALRAAIERATENAAKGAADMARLGAGAERGAVASREAADMVGEVATALAAAAGPIRETANRFEAAGREVAQATTASAKTMTTGAESLVKSAQTALEAGRETLNTEKGAIRSGLRAIETSLERFERVAKDFDNIDDKLGGAFAKYRTEVEKALNDLDGRSKSIFEKHARALDTLTTVVSQAEAFRSEQKR